MYLNCQRWREHRSNYRPAGEPINTSYYDVQPLDFAPARDFIIEHHYSASHPSARFSVGLYRMSQLVGVAMFSHPQNERTFPRYVKSVRGTDGIELGRFVLLDDVPANGETWFLCKAFELLHETKPEVRMVLSFSDPVQRRTASGRIILPGHVGTIYQAHNGRYCGKAGRKTLWLDPDGQVMNKRTLSKIRNQEVGAKSAYERLCSMGARPKRRCEAWRDYLKVVLSEAPFRKINHPGNHAYIWAVGNKAVQRAVLRDALPARSYPKQIEPAA